MEVLLKELFKDGIITSEMDLYEARSRLAIAIISQTGICPYNLRNASVEYKNDLNGISAFIVVRPPRKSTNAKFEQRISITLKLYQAIKLYQENFSHNEKLIFRSIKPDPSSLQKLNDKYASRHKEQYKGVSFTNLRHYALTLKKNGFQATPHSAMKSLGHCTSPTTHLYIDKKNQN